ncbi:MAG: hypothetical protein ACRELB_22405, partial [Polyangiaceae bacterium]
MLPDGATTTYEYDAASGLSAVEHAGFRLDFERDAAGRETARRGGAGLSVTSRYDACDRLLERRAVAPGIDGNLPNVLAERRWSYDRSGRVERLDDARWGTTTYSYDAVHQLLEARRGAQREAFSYDPAGSLVAALQELGGNRRALDMDVAAGDVLVRAGDVTYAHDARGRRVRKTTEQTADAPRTTEYGWDGRDLLRSATLPDGARITLTYDALGRRTCKE